MAEVTTNDEAFARARRSIPGGVNSPVRAFRSVGGTPRFLVSARGPSVTDVEGREYVDLVASWGPALLGHAHPEVVAAVQDAAARGLSFGASTPAETELAELVVERLAVTPGSHHLAGESLITTRPIDELRLVSTGTEATMTAIRLARGATGRPLVIKFSGLYHGHSDGLLADAGSGLATLALPASAGVPAEIAAQTIVLPYNDRSVVEAAFAEHGDRIAAIITEAAPANMGVVPPWPGFNAFLADTAHAHGALLILDEVLTGFRVSSAGFWELDAFAIREEDDGSRHLVSPTYVPDLFTFGKVIGGGMPLAALGGRRDLMNQLAPVGPVYQAGTLSGNPVAVAAGLATLHLADADVYAKIDHTAAVISEAVDDALTASGVPHFISRAGNLFSIQFRDTPALDYAGVQAQDAFRYGPFFHAMLDSGVSLPPSVFEAWFVTAAHDEDAVGRVLDALPAAARAAASARPA